MTPTSDHRTPALPKGIEVLELRPGEAVGSPVRHLRVEGAVFLSLPRGETHIRPTDGTWDLLLRFDFGHFLTGRFVLDLESAGGGEVFTWEACSQHSLPGRQLLDLGPVEAERYLTVRVSQLRNPLTLHQAAIRLAP